MDETVRYKSIPLTTAHRWRIKDKPIKYGLILPSQQADSDSDDNNQSSVVEQRYSLSQTQCLETFKADTSSSLLL